MNHERFPLSDSRISLLLCLRAGAALCLSTSLVVLSASGTAFAQFDTTTGKEGVAAEKSYHDEQKQRAQTIVDQIDPKSVTHHPYWEGTDADTINKNNLYDKDVILNPETYDECLDYDQIGTCETLVLVDGKPTVIETPYVRYFGPWQKGEEVPEAFRTGYVEKDVIKEEKRKVIEELKYYEEDGFAKEMIESELTYHRDVALPYLNNRLGKSFSVTDPVPTPNIDIIQKTRAAIEKYGPNNFGEASMAQDGFVFNDYHLFPAISANYSPGGAQPPFGDPNNPIPIDELPNVPPGPGDEMLPPSDGPFYGWCHIPKQPYPFLGESTGNLPFSRKSVQTSTKFPEVQILQSDPLNCIGFNIANGRTPPELAGLAIGASPAVCQGVNQGAWLPVTYRVHSMYQTTAAAIGLVRSRLANRLDPLSFYDIEPKPDKVQWIQNDRMDGASSIVGKTPSGAIGKKCSKIEKFVLEYERGNLKIGPMTTGDNGPGRDHWNVLAHWRKIKCCPNGGVPKNVFVPGEDLKIILE